MRYRVKDYTVDVYQGNVQVSFNVPSTIFEASYPSVTDADRRKITESIRLIVDETAGVVFCSSMLKDNIVLVEAQNNTDGTTEITIYFAIPTGKTIASTDQFTIEMDWGEQATDIIDKIGTSADTSSTATVFGQLKAIKNLVGECTLEQNNDGTDTYTLILDRMAIIQGNTVEIL